MAMSDVFTKWYESSVKFQTKHNESGVNYNVNGKYTKYNRTTMRPNFYVLEYFHHTLASFVAPSTNGTAKCLVGYKARLVL